MTLSGRLRDIALVVDDSPETVSMLTDALEAEGVTVLVALDGPSALKIAGQITPDIVLLDAVMPGLDGFETCRSLKRMQASRAFPSSS
jgi:DNA-binding response OmpR family regulator